MQPTTRATDTGLPDPKTAYATVLLLWAMDALGKDEEGKWNLFEWHPETIRMEVDDRLPDPLPRAAFDRLMAAVSIVTTDLFYKDAWAFIQLANVLSGDDFSPDEFDPADSMECAWAITEALFMDGMDGDDPEPFSEEVRAYIGRVLHREGYVTPPDVLRIAKDADHSAEVEARFAGNPEGMAAVRAEQERKRANVVDMIRDSLQGLSAQLSQLQLKEGNASGLAANLAMALAGGTMKTEKE